MVAPRASIDVQQLILSIAWVEFVFQLHQSVVVDGPQEALRQGLQERQLNGLYERAGPAELGRVLATPPDDHAADRPASLEEGAVGELLSPITWNQVLNHHFTQSNLPNCPLEELPQFGPVVRSPCFGLRCVDKVLFDCWLECQGRVNRDLFQLVFVLRAPGFRRGNPQFIRQTIGIPFVTHPLHCFPLGGRYAEPFCQH